MKHTVLFIFMLSICLKAVSQPDTMVYKKQIDKLTDHVSKQTYFDTLFQRDQQNRGNNAIALFDLENLISISYYFNSFEYPTEEEFGEASAAPRLIWIHNSYHGLRRLTFPLIYMAYQSGQITESKLRDYYLRTMYAARFDDDLINEIPLPELFELLDLNTTDSISIEALITYMEEKRKFNSQPKKEVLKWNGAEKSKWVTENGERKLWKFKTSPVEIFTLENCKIYFRKLHSDNSYEPRELQKIGEHSFRFRDVQSDKYFEMDAEGNLMYRNDQEVFDIYLKQE